MTEKKYSISRATPLRPHKSAVIVGASSGIGAALARKLAHEGYAVACLARREDLLTDLCDDINREFSETRAVPYVHDVRDYNAIPPLLQKILTDLGGLDLFIYNAGVMNKPGLDVYSFSLDQPMLETNLIGAVAWLDPVAELFHHLKAGQIVGISSVAGDRGRVGNPAYNASKAALTCYLEALRNRLTRRGVNVLTVKPGFVDTIMTRDAERLFWLITPDQAANAIWKGIRRRKQEIYVPGQWRWLMLIIKHIPSFIFRRLSF